MTFLETNSENELLLFEWRWFWRFMRTWPAWLLFILQATLIFGVTQFGPFIPLLFIYYARSGLGYYLAPWVRPSSRLFLLFVQELPWIYLFQRRVLRRLSEPTREDLLMAPINGRVLWPALLLAPLLWSTVIWLGAYWVACLPQLFLHPLLSAGRMTPGYRVPPGYYAYLFSVTTQITIVANGFLLTVLLGRWIRRNSNPVLFWFKTLLAMILINYVNFIVRGLFFTFGGPVLSSGPVDRYKMDLIPIFANSLLYLWIGFTILRGMRSEQGWAMFLLQSKGKEFVPPTPDFKPNSGGLSFVASAFTRSFLCAFGFRCVTAFIAIAAGSMGSGPAWEGIFFLGPTILGIGFGLYFSRGILRDDTGVASVLGFFSACFGALVGSLAIFIGGAP